MTPLTRARLRVVVSSSPGYAPYFFLHGGLVTGGNSVPADELVKESGHVVGAAVLDVKVVSVLPNIHGKDGGEALGDGHLSIRSLDNLELLVLVDDEPSPAGAELGGTSSFELSAEVVEGAEGRVDGLGEVTGRLTTTVGLHRLPEEGMVPDLGSVVEDRGGLTVVPRGEDNLLKGLSFEGGAGNELVAVVDVGTVVLAPVELKGALGHVGFKGIKSVGGVFEDEGGHGPDLTARGTGRNSLRGKE